MTGQDPKKRTRRQISNSSKAQLKKFAKKVGRKHKGGSHTPGHLSEVSGVEESWNLVNNLLNQSAPIDLGPPRQVSQNGGKKKSSKKSYSLRGGGEQSSGATFLPAQWNNPKATLPKGNDPSRIDGAYGGIIAKDGFDRNLSAFPDSSMQQTGGAKKLKKSKKAKKTDTSTEPAKKSKKTSTSKKGKSLWEKIKSFF